MTSRTATTIMGLVLIVCAACSYAQGSIEIPCAGSPPNAVIELPIPLKQWGQIHCTIFGHTLTSKENWVWSIPGAYAPVHFPAQMLKDNPSRVGNEAFFTQILLDKLSGPEAEAASAKINSKRSTKKEPIESAYHLTLTNNEGRSHEVFFVRTVSEAIDNKGFWGYWCSAGCSDGMPFMLLNYEGTK